MLRWRNYCSFFWHEKQKKYFKLLKRSFFSSYLHFHTSLSLIYSANKTFQLALVDVILWKERRKKNPSMSRCCKTFPLSLLFSLSFFFLLFGFICKRVFLLSRKARWKIFGHQQNEKNFHSGIHQGWLFSSARSSHSTNIPSLVLRLLCD